MVAYDQQAALSSAIRYAKDKGLQEGQLPSLLVRARPLTTITEQDAREPYSYLHLQLVLHDKVIWHDSLGLDGIRAQDLGSVPTLPATVMGE